MNSSSKDSNSKFNGQNNRILIQKSKCEDVRVVKESDLRSLGEYPRGFDPHSSQSFGVAYCSSEETTKVQNNVGSNPIYSIFAPIV